MKNILKALQQDDTKIILAIVGVLLIILLIGLLVDSIKERREKKRADEVAFKKFVQEIECNKCYCKKYQESRGIGFENTIQIVANESLGYKTCPFKKTEYCHSMTEEEANKIIENEKKAVDSKYNQNKGILYINDSPVGSLSSLSSIPIIPTINAVDLMIDKKKTDKKKKKKGKKKK